MNRWRGKVALVTGASSGIGAEIAKLLVKNGVNVVGIARNMEKLEKIGEEIGKDKYFPIKCDIMKEEDILNVFEWVEKKFKGIDILVNNAAILHTGFFIDQKTEEYRKILDTNLLAPAIFSREAVLSMKKRDAQGHIINISSIAGSHLDAILIPLGLYGPTKGGMLNLSTELRHEIIQSKLNIKVTTIAPGLVMTNMTNELIKEREMQNIRTNSLEAIDIAEAVIYVLETPERVEIPQITLLPHKTPFILSNKKEVL